MAVLQTLPSSRSPVMFLIALQGQYGFMDAVRGMLRRPHGFRQILVILREKAQVAAREQRPVL